MLRRYLVPRIGTNQYVPHGAERVLDEYRPKYFGDMRGIDYSLQRFAADGGLFIVTANLSDFDHADVMTHPDVYLFPDDMTIEVDPADISPHLARAGLSLGNLTDTISHDELLSRFDHQFNLSQIVEGLHANTTGQGLSLDTPFSQYSELVRDLMSAAPADGATLRDVLGAVAAKRFQRRTGWKPKKKPRG